MTQIDKQAAEFERLKAKRKTMMKTHTPQNSATPHRAPVAAALQARLDAGRAAFAAAEAKVTAKKAAAELQPAATITAAEFETKPLRMARSEFAKLSPSDKTRFAKLGGKITA